MLQEKVLLLLSLNVAFQQVISMKFNDDKCDEQLFAFTEAIREKEIWALRLFDLWGKIEAGYLFGNIKSLGRFNECLNYTESVKDVGIVQGQHCMISWSFPKSVLLMEIPGKTTNVTQLQDYLQNPRSAASNGICLPSTCSLRKVLEFANLFLNPVNLTAVDAKCQTREQLLLDNIDIAAISMLSVFGVLLLASTAYDIIVRRRSKDRDPHDLLIAFSLYSNCKTLFKVDRSKANTIDCLDGLRCISVFCIIFYHRHLINQGRPTSNFIEVIKRIPLYWSVLLYWQTYCVDTFLVIGGLLCALHLLKAFEIKKFNFFKSIIHRYVRYTPILAASILIFASISRHVKGPSPDVVTSDDCSHYWWSALLHIQNYVNPEKFCAMHTWYLSVDFQLFVLSPLLIYPALRFGWKYLWVLLALAVASSVFVTMTCLNHKFNALGLLFDAQEYHYLVYFPTHARMGPWFIGMIVGYIIFESRAREIRMNKALVGLLWLMSISALVLVLSLLHSAYQIEDNQLTELEASMFKGFSRLVWSISIAWIIFACYKLKSGGIIRKCLSWPEWQPLGRLSLCMYITHVFYQRLTAMVVNTTQTFEIIPMVNEYLGDLFASLMLGIVFWLTFETPFFLIENYVQNTFVRKVSKPEMIVD